MRSDPRIRASCACDKPRGIIPPSERWGRELDVLIALLVVLSIIGVLLLALIAAIYLNLFSGDMTAENRTKVWKHIRDYGNWYLAALAWSIAWVLVWLNNVPKVEEGVPASKGGLIWEPALVALSLGLIALLVFSQIYDKEAKGPNRMRAAIAATFIFLFLFLVVDLLTIQGFRDALSDISDVKVEVTTENGLVVSTSVSETNCEATPTPAPIPEPAPGASGASGAKGTTDAAAASGATGAGTEEADACVPVSNDGAATFVEGLFGTFKWALTAIIAFYFLAGAVEKVSEDRTEQERQRTAQEQARAQGGAAGPAGADGGGGGPAGGGGGGGGSGGGGGEPEQESPPSV
jgi:uncharacterized membrane protein YgcG